VKKGSWRVSPGSFLMGAISYHYNHHHYYRVATAADGDGDGDDDAGRRLKMT